MDLSKTLKISAAGMQAQNARMRTIAENLANADSLAEKPGADPYRRKMLTFKTVLDRATGVVYLLHPIGRRTGERLKDWSGLLNHESTGFTDLGAGFEFSLWQAETGPGIDKQCA